jgi:hypothetical protein
VPVTLAVCGVLLALSVTVKVALRVPTAVGVNVTSIEQLAPAARLAPQLFVCAKSPLLVPVKAMLVMLIGELVPFSSATAWAPLVELTVWPANVSEEGDRLTEPPVEVPPLNAAKMFPFQFEFG